MQAVRGDQLTAYHEAGHAVAAVLLRRRFTYVSLGGALHSTLLGAPIDLEKPYNAKFRPETRVQREVMTVLAGSVAGRLYQCRPVAVSGDDLERAHLLASGVCGSPQEAQAYVAWLTERTHDLLAVEASWRAVEAVARELLRRRELRGKQTREIIRGVLTASMTANARGHSRVPVTTPDRKKRKMRRSA